VSKRNDDKRRKSLKNSEKENRCRDFKCFYKDKDGNVEICDEAPCLKHLNKFGIHERIIEYYIKESRWDDAYFYFKDLMSLSCINCDLEELEKIKAKSRNARVLVRPEDYPIGCRIFLFSRDLKDIKDLINHYTELDYETIGKTGKDVLSSKINEFKGKMYSNIEMLAHLVMDRRTKKVDTDYYHGQLLDLYSEARKARSEGLNVEDGVGSGLDAAFDELGVKAGLGSVRTRKLADFNDKRVGDVRADAILEKMRVEFLEEVKRLKSENKEIPEFLIQKLRELGVHGAI